MTDTLIEDRSPSATEHPGSRTRPRGLLLVLLLAGILLDLAMQTPADGFALFAGTLVVGIGLVTIGALQPGTGRALVVAALVPAFFLFVRTSPWLVSLDLLAVGLLLALGTSLSSGQRLFDLTFGQATRLLTATIGAVFVAPARVAETVALAAPAPDESRRSRYAAIGRGISLAFPIVLVLGLLLSSADGVFASFLDLDIGQDISSLPSHLILVGLGTCLAGGLFVQSSRRQAISVGRPPFTVGPVEGALVLAGLIAVYSLFAVARLLVMTRGDHYVMERTGLTYAEYARSGFFQLLWAAGLTLLVLIGLRAIVVLPSRRSRRGFVMLVLAAVALTLVVVWTAIERLGLYEDAFGLTMLRLYSTTFAWWIGVLFVLTGLALAGLWSRRQWLPGAVLCSALLALLLVNVSNPERVVIERNAERAADGADFDVDYALALSDDSIPALVDTLHILHPDERSAVLLALCRRTPGDEPTSWNLSTSAAARSLESACTGR